MFTYLIIIFVVNYLGLELFFEKFKVIYILLSLTFLNFLNRLFLGDNGTYLIGLVFSFLLIKFHMSYELISPYFIVLLLWYPAFEILFSIIRKILQNKSPMFPDNLHLHQLIFEKINKAVNKKIFSMKAHYSEDQKIWFKEQRSKFYKDKEYYDKLQKV